MLTLRGGREGVAYTYTEGRVAYVYTEGGGEGALHCGLESWGPIHKIYLSFILKLL